jgi:hypothetical protein
MKWTRLSEWCVQSSCLGYTITKSGPPDALVFQAWRGKALLLTTPAGHDEVDAKRQCAEACKRDQG